MRKLVILPVVAFAMGFLALANAEPAPSSPASKPQVGPVQRVVLAKVPSITNVTITTMPRTNGGSTNTKPPPAFEVEVDNPAATPLESQISIFNAGKDLKGSVAITAPAKATGKAYLPVESLVDACAPMVLRFMLKGTTDMRSFKTTPTCVFQRAVNDPDAGISMEQKLAARKNKVSYEMAALPAPAADLACGVPITISAFVRNGFGPGVFAKGGLRIAHPQAALSVQSELTQFAQPGIKQMQVTLPAFQGYPGEYVLKVATLPDTPVYEPGWSLKVSRQCTYATAPFTD